MKDNKNTHVKLESWNVTRAYEFKDGNISFDMEVNGIKLYGLTLVWYKKEKKYFVSFPARKSGDQYYKYFYFDIDDELTEAITEAIREKLDRK